MKVSPTIDLFDMVKILRENLEQRFGCEIENITITSYDVPRITIDASFMVECVAFRHRAKE